MDAKTTALLIVDDNNDFLSEGGKLYTALAPFLLARETIDAINAAAEAVRTAGGVVIRTPLSFNIGYPEMGDDPYGVFAVVKQSGGFQKGSWGAQPSQVITPNPRDIVVEGKCSLDTFASTDVDKVLHALGIKTIAVSGVISNLCIASTIRTAYDKGYEVIGLTDGAAALDPRHHDDTVKNDYPLYSKPMSTQDFVNTIQQA